MKKLQSIVSVSKTSGIGRDRLYNLIRSNPDLPFVIRIGKTCKINVDLFYKWLDEKSINGGKL